MIAVPEQRSVYIDSDRFGFGWHEVKVGVGYDGGEDLVIVVIQELQPDADSGVLCGVVGNGVGEIRCFCNAQVFANGWLVVERTGEVSVFREEGVMLVEFEPEEV